MENHTAGGAGTSVPLDLRQAGLRVRDGSGERELTRNLTLSVARGHVTALHGPSGSGKSTLLRACVRLHPLAEGEILVDGQPVTSYPPPDLRRRVAYLRQFPVFTPGTVRESLLEAFHFNASTDSAPGDDTLRDALASLDQPAALLDQPTARLSGGEAQAVAFVRAMLLGPSVLLLDEPTASLDPDHEDALVRRVTDWVAEGDRAALWVTHDRTLLERWPGQGWRLTRDGLLPTEAGA